jgi:hypothetical protein
MASTQSAPQWVGVTRWSLLVSRSSSVVRRSSSVVRRSSSVVRRSSSVVRRQPFVVSLRSSSPRVSHCHPEGLQARRTYALQRECRAPASDDHSAERPKPRACLQSTSSSFPVVFRASRSRCACCASFSGYRCSIRSFSFPAAIMPNTAPARF